MYTSHICICLPIDIVEYLLEKTSGGGGASESKVELGNNEGRTLLHIAALTDNKELVTYLLDKHHASKTSVWTHKVSEGPFTSLISSHLISSNLIWTGQWAMSSSVQMRWDEMRWGESCERYLAYWRQLLLFKHVVTLPPGQSEVLWWVCLSVCHCPSSVRPPSVFMDISGTTRPKFNEFSAHVASGCGSVLFPDSIVLRYVLPVLWMASC